MGYVKVIQSGNFLEVYKYQNDLRKSGIYYRKRSKRRFIKLRSLRVDNIQQRKKRLKRLILSNLVSKEFPTLLTLTMHQCLSLRRGWSIFAQFYRKLRKTQKANLKYIAVAEFQKRGAVHFHVLIWGLPDYVIKQERDTRNIQRIWQRGFVDCLPTDGNVKLAGYLNGYLSKSLSDERHGGARCYNTSSNVLRPLLVSSDSPFVYSKEIFGRDLRIEQPLSEKNFYSKWLGNGNYRLYEL